MGVIGIGATEPQIIQGRVSYNCGVWQALDSRGNKKTHWGGKMENREMNPKRENTYLLSDEDKAFLSLLHKNKSILLDRLRSLGLLSSFQEEENGTKPAS